MSLAARTSPKLPTPTPQFIAFLSACADHFKKSIVFPDDSSSLFLLTSAENIHDDVVQLAVQRVMQLDVQRAVQLAVQRAVQRAAQCVPSGASCAATNSVQSLHMAMLRPSTLRTMHCEPNRYTAGKG